MRFEQFAPYFTPEELSTLTAAFNATWKELKASESTPKSRKQIATMKRKLAQRILVSATAGKVRDLPTLKEQALRSLSRPSRSL